MRTRNLLRVNLGLLLVLLAKPIVAQPPPAKPGPEHELLKKYVGTWDAVISMAGQDSKGTAVYKLGLGGLWLLTDFKADLGGMKFEGHGTSGYDPTKKKYVSTWIDSMSLGITLMQGTYDPKTKTMTFTYEESDPSSGKKMKSRDVSKITDDDNQSFEMYKSAEGKPEFKAMEIHYTRVKK